MLWFEVRLNATRVGLVEVQRREVLDRSDPATADAVSTYDVRLDSRRVGAVEHRYGDGAFALVAKAAGMVAGEIR